jgi:hypothetical protein
LITNRGFKRQLKSRAWNAFTFSVDGLHFLTLMIRGQRI